MGKVEVERRGAISLVTLNRPEVHNCIDAETADLLAGAIEAFSDDEGARAMVITGAGGRAFCSGADLTVADGLFAREDVERTGPLGFSHLEAGKPVIAAIEGNCLAGGLELACWCDFRIAGRGAIFGVVNRRWGIPLIDGGTQRLPRIVGVGNALYLLETGVMIEAPTARAMGLVQEVVSAGGALGRAMELAGHVVEYPQSAMLADRTSAIAAHGMPLPDGLRQEAKRGLGGTEEMLEGLRRFREGNRPQPPREPGS